MSLVSLCRSERSTERRVRAVTSDEFINGAQLYAIGQSAECSVTTETKEPEKKATMRRSTFTLTPECIEQLTLLSQCNNTSRSALIRQWIAENIDKEPCVKSTDAK